MTTASRFPIVSSTMCRLRPFAFFSVYSSFFCGRGGFYASRVNDCVAGAGISLHVCPHPFHQRRADLLLKPDSAPVSCRREQRLDDGPLTVAQVTRTPVSLIFLYHACSIALFTYWYRFETQTVPLVGIKITCTLICQSASLPC